MAAAAPLHTHTKDFQSFPLGITPIPGMVWRLDGRQQCHRSGQGEGDRVESQLGSSGARFRGHIHEWVRPDPATARTYCILKWVSM